MENLATMALEDIACVCVNLGGLVRPQLLTKPRFPRKLDDAMAITAETSTGPTAKVAPPVGTPIPGAVLARRLCCRVGPTKNVEWSINRVQRPLSRHSILRYPSLLPQTF
jgi:hypothetical protein